MPSERIVIMRACCKGVQLLNSWIMILRYFFNLLFFLPVIRKLRMFNSHALICQVLLCHNILNKTGFKL